MPQSSAQKAHADLCLLPTVRPVAKLPSRLRRWGWIPTHGPVKRILSSLPPPSELALARQSGAVTMTHVQDKLTNWGTPRPHHRTPCDAQQHGNRQEHSILRYRLATACRALIRASRTAPGNGSPASIASLPTVSGAFALDYYQPGSHAASGPHPLERVRWTTFWVVSRVDSSGTRRT
jgi:hypothetical protein